MLGNSQRCLISANKVTLKDKTREDKFNER